jgi:hypothetical protein
VLTGLGILQLGRPGLTVAAGVEQSGPPVSRSTPFVSGNAYTGQTLSCGTGSWLGARPLSYAYQWKNAGSNLSGETAKTYVLLVTDEGDNITCVVTATNGDGNASATSNTVVPSAAPTAPVNSVAPAVTGNAFTGQTLSCSTGTWSQSPTDYAYQWKRAGSNISSATSSTYVVVLADVGASVKCTVTAVNAVGAGTPTDSNAVTPVGIPVNSVAPAVTGTTEVGQTLSCSTGTWSGSPSFTYQWKRDGVSIGSATSSTYLLDALDEATNIKCTVGASNLAGSGTSTDSNTVGPIDPANPELFPGWTTGRVFSWADDPTDFTTSNYTVTTDGGEPALVHTTGHEFDEVSVLTNATDIGAARVEIRYRAQPASGLSIQNISMKPRVRDIDSNNYWEISRDFGAGHASWMLVGEKIAGTAIGGSALGGDGDLDNTDTTHDQWLVLDVFWDVLRGKTWFASDAEPGWKGVLRFRPAGGFGSPSGNQPSLDNTVETGKAGLRAMYGGIIKDVIVTELVPTDPDNLILNAALDPDLLDSNSKPFFWDWDSKWNSETTGIVSQTTAVGPDGSTTIPVLRCARSSAGGIGDAGPEAIQLGFLTGTADNASYTRDRPIPTYGAAFPATVDCSAWVKTISLATTGVQIGSAQHVLYYSDSAGTGLNITHNDYYGPIAPDTGSQAWTHVTWTTTIHDNADAVISRLFLGMHDDGATGEILIAGGAYGPTFKAGV